MAIFYKCSCGAVYREGASHGWICMQGKYPKDTIADREEVKRFWETTYSCLLCGTRTILPHVCPALNQGSGDGNR